MAQLMKWEELTTGRGRVATNTEGNAKINEGNLPKHIFTLTLLLYRMHIKPRKIYIPNGTNQTTSPACTFLRKTCTFLTNDEDEIVLNDIKSSLPQVDQGIELYWVVFPQVDQNRNAKCWDMLPQFNEK